MDFLSIPEVRNNMQYYKLKIIKSFDYEYSPKLENITEEYEYLLNLKKILQDSLPDHVYSNIAIPLTVLNLFIIILGVFGNVTTCIVIIKNQTLRNTTNYYLSSLAVSDLILLIIGMILDFRYLWQTYFWAWGLTFCISLHYIHNVAYNVSILTVMAFSFERYLAICHPLHFNSMSGLKRPIGFILSLWIIGSILSSVQLLRHLTKYLFQLPSGSIIDTEKLLLCEFTYGWNIYTYEIINFITFFLSPMTVMIILYIKMGMKIRESWKTSKLNSGKDFNFIRQQSRQNTVRMLCVVVIVTFICWAPNSLVFLSEQTGDIQSMNYNEYHLVTFISDLFFYSSTIVNPLIYNLMSSRYRNAFKNTLWGKKNSVNVTHDVEKNLIKATSI